MRLPDGLQARLIHLLSESSVKQEHEIRFDIPKKTLSKLVYSVVSQPVANFALEDSGKAGPLFKDVVYRLETAFGVEATGVDAPSKNLLRRHDRHQEYSKLANLWFAYLKEQNQIPRLSNRLAQFSQRPKRSGKNVVVYPFVGVTALCYFFGRDDKGVFLRDELGVPVRDSSRTDVPEICALF